MDPTLYKRIGELTKKHRHYPNVYNPADPSNRQNLIEKNLKMAVNVALQYRGLGLSEDELISAAFEGLAVAYDKYDGSKALTRDKLLKDITEDTTPTEFAELVEKHLPYSNVCKMFEKGMPQTSSEMRDWVNRNVRPAKFTSVAYFWVRALILSELEKYSKPLRVAESYRVDNQFAYLDEEGAQFSDKITYEETDPEEVEEAYQKLYEGIPEYCLNILFMRHGVGHDAAMTLREIADLHGRTVGQIKEILSDVTERITSNIRRYNLKISDLLG